MEQNQPGLYESKNYHSFR